MARQRGASGGGRRNTATAKPFSSSAYTSRPEASGKRSRQANAAASSSQPAAPKDVHDVYNFAVSQTDDSSKKQKSGRGARRATAGMNEGDFDDLPSKAKRSAPPRRGSDSEDDEDDDEDDLDRAPIGPKVFDSDDELNGEIEGDDEDIDSDEAFGESDDEKFEGWKFGRNQASAGKQSKRQSAEDSEEEAEDEDGEDGMVDLSRMLDSGSESSDAESGEQDEQESDQDNSADEKLQKHIDTYASTKRNADDQEGDEPSAKRSRRVLSERTEAVPETEFAPSGSGSTLRLEDFLDPLASSVSFSDLRKTAKVLGAKKGDSSSGNAPLASKKGGGALAAPLPAVVQDRLDRQGAYAMTRDEVQGWQPTINKIRDAEHLSFPLQKPVVTKPSTAGLVANFTPSNDMENSIAAMLESGGMTEKQLAEQEDLAMNKLDPVEAQARRDELRRMRLLMFRAEQKAKRIGKIKSKAYRKVHRKEKERLQAQIKELEAQDDVDSDQEMDERLKAEKQRARERATLKHKNTSKWAKNILSARHGEHTLEARQEVEAQLRRGEELRQKIQGRDLGDSDPDSDDDDDYSGDEVDARQHAFDELATLEAKEDQRRQKDEAELAKAGGKNGVYNMKFMKDAREREYSKIRGDVDDFVEEMQALDHSSSDDEADEKAAAAASSTYVNGNKGRAVYGAGFAATPDDAEDEGAPTEDQIAPSAKSNVPTSVEIGGQAMSNKSASNKRKGEASKAASKAADASSNPWLTMDTSSASKLSKKKNESSLSRTSTDGAAKSAARLSKQAAKSADASAHRQQDESISIDVGAQLGNFENEDEGDNASDVDSEGDAVQPALVNQGGKKKKSQGNQRMDAFQQRDLVSAAFAGDDVVSAFQAEKEEMVSRDESKTIDTTLPGWGSWTGKGTRAPRPGPSKFSKTIKGVDRAQRKDAAMSNVIINEKRDKKMDKFRVRDLPHPYTSVAQYQAAMQNPLGQEWNTRIETQRLNMPRVTKKPGKVIRPIERKF